MKVIPMYIFEPDHHALLVWQFQDAFGQNIFTFRFQSHMILQFLIEGNNRMFASYSI